MKKDIQNDDYTMDYRSRFHFWKTRVVRILLPSIMLLQGCILFLAQPKSDGTKVALTLISICLVASGIYAFYKYFKQLPVISINDTGIRFSYLTSNKQFSWFEIESIQHSGKASFMSGDQKEAITIRLKDQQVMKIFYEFYTNGPYIQQYLKSYHELQHAPMLIQEQKVTAEELAGVLFTAYKGMALWSVYSIMMWVPMLFTIVFAVVSSTHSLAVPFGILSILLYATSSYFGFYIRVSANHLVIKNYFIPFAGKMINPKIFKILAISFARFRL